MKSKWSIAACCLGLVIASGTAVAKEPPVLRVSFTTEDGVTIVGDYHAPKGRALATPAILLHMYRNNRASWEPLVAPLHEAGFAVLAIDLRGHGESVKPAKRNLAHQVEERNPAIFNAMHQDVAAAVKWVRAQSNIDPKKVVLVGASVGCSVALDYASRAKVDAVVCMTPGTAYLGVDSLADIRKTRATSILLFATKDERESTDKLAKAADNAKAEIVAPGRIHGTRMFGKVVGIERRITEFLHDAVAEPRPGED